MRFPLALLLALAASLPASAAAPNLQVSGWARPTVPGQSTAAAFLVIRSRGQGDRLLALGSSAAAATSVHRTSTAGGVARMRPVGPLAIGPNQVLTMEAGGLHVMLTGLKAPLRPGTRLPMNLRFERAGIIRISLPIQMSAPDAGHNYH